MRPRAYVIRNRHGRYLEYVPARGTWEWLASDEEHATPVSDGDATLLLLWLHARGEQAVEVEDYYGRRPANYPIPEEA